MFRNMLAIFNAAVTSSLSADTTVGILRTTNDVLGSYIDREYVLLTEDLLMLANALKTYQTSE